MKLLKAMAIAFSIYSKIPVPQFEWKEEDMEYMMCFFPWIGGVIGLFFFGWAVLCEKFAVGNVCYALIGAAIPLMISGGFQADGVPLSAMPPLPVKYLHSHSLSRHW